MYWCDCAAESGGVCCTFEWCDACPGGRSVAEWREARRSLHNARFRRREKVWFEISGRVLEGTVQKALVNRQMEIMYIILTMEKAQHQVPEAQLYHTWDEAAYALSNRKQQ